METKLINRVKALTLTLFVLYRDSKLPPSGKGSAATKASAKSAKSRSLGAQSAKSLATSGQLSPTPFMTGSKLVQMKNSLSSVWDDYKQRTDVIRVIGRNLSLVSIIEMWKNHHNRCV